MLLTLVIGALMLGGIYGLVGMGYGLIYKASGLMTLAQGDMLMIGAFLGLTFYKTLGLPFLVSLLLVMVIMFALGMFIERVLVTFHAAAKRSHVCLGLQRHAVPLHLRRLLCEHSGL